MKSYRPFAASVIFCLLGTFPAPGAPFQPLDVPANPAMVIHVDGDAIRNCSLTKFLLAKPGIGDKLSTMGGLFGFDLATQVHGLTIYTTAEKPSEGILIAYADFDPDRLIKLNKDPNFNFDVNLTLDNSLGGTNKMPLRGSNFKTTTVHSHTIYSWSLGPKKAGHRDQNRTYSAMWGNRLIFAHSESQVADALDVMEKKTNSFAGTMGLPASAPGESILAQGVIFKFGFGDDGPEAQVFKMTKELRFKASEVSTNTIAVVRGETEDASRASQLAAVVQGLFALLKLQMTEDDVKDFDHATTIRQDGSFVEVRFSLPTAAMADKTQVHLDRTQDNNPDTRSAKAKK